MSVKLQQEVVSYLFFLQLGEGSRAALHHQRHAAHDLKDVLVFFFVDGGLRVKPNTLMHRSDEPGPDDALQLLGDVCGRSIRAPLHLVSEGGGNIASLKYLVLALVDRRPRAVSDAIIVLDDLLVDALHVRDDVVDLPVYFFFHGFLG